MNSVPSLFNRKLLDKYLSVFTVEDISDYEKKRREILKWVNVISQGDFRRTKEESIKGEFLTSVFGKILDYSTRLEGGEYNQIQEYTSELDTTEADGALGFFTADTKIVRAVIELKDASTYLDKRQHRKNNQSPVEQAFSYAHKNGSGCGWVIVSNFTEIRLYKSSSSLEYENFLITQLDNEAEFRKFYTLLCKDNLIARDGKSLVDELFEANCQAQAVISQEFYSKYSALRTELFHALKVNNTSTDDMALFQSAQKILDRTIFICFCENRLLLPEGIFKRAVYVGQNTFSAIENRVWGELRGLFRAIDAGSPTMNINGYNGGLFRPDPILDGLKVPDKALEKLAGLLDYDFGSDLNVNILGHIFEQSISDMERLKAEINGLSHDRQKSRQKAEGIYYTPNYVTQYIARQTIGRWLEDKRRSFGFDTLPALEDSDFQGVKPGVARPRHSKNIEKHINAWEAYKDALLNIKVLDPACGSSAFLNEAFDYLYSECLAVSNELQRLLQGQAVLNLRWDRHILANNIFGVDLSRESVDITKLSLWLKTASRDEKLIDLDSNIKVGNSLISDKNIAGPLAFDWRCEFQDIMASGGFDIVLGNPPYGALLSQIEKDYITASYETTEYNFDTYKTFMELALKLTRQDGYTGFITPNTYFVLEKGANKLRRFLFENYTLFNVVELFNVFPAAVVEPVISIYKNARPKDDDGLEAISIPRKTDLDSTFIADGVRTAFVQSDLRRREGYVFNFRETEAERLIVEKINSIAKPLYELFEVSVGVKLYEVGKGTPPQTQEILDEKPFEGYSRIDEFWKPYTRGRTIERYTDKWDGEYINYGEWLAALPKNADIFYREKLFVRQTGDCPIATYDSSGKICNRTLHCIHQRDIGNNESVSLKYLLGIINSTLMKWIFQRDNFHMVGKPLAQVKKVYVERLPVVVVKDQSAIVSHVDSLLINCQAKFDKTKQFVDWIVSFYSPKSVSEKVWEFYKLDFREFIDELKKQKIVLTARQQMEFMPLFNEKSEEINRLTHIIDKLDYELDCIVYKLYSLTQKEIDIVKGLWTI